MTDRDRLALAERSRLALAERDRLAVFADRDRLAEREYYERYPAREELPYRVGPDEYGRGRPILREEYGRLAGPMDEDLRRDEYGRSRMRDEYGRPLPQREGFREARDLWDRVPPGREPWERAPLARDPREERPAPGRDYREWERSREMYGEVRSRDPRMVLERAGPPVGYGERGSPPRDWPRDPPSRGLPPTPQQRPGFKDPREPPTSSGPNEEVERRPQEGGTKGLDMARYDSYNSPEITDMKSYGQHSYHENEDSRHRGREIEFDVLRRGSPSGGRGHRGRGTVSRGGPPRVHPRSTPFNRGQSRRGGGQGR